MNSSSQLSLTPPRAERAERAAGQRHQHAPFLPRARSASAVARARRACPQYIALITLVVIFVCALYFAISNWRGIDRNNSLESDWAESLCNLTDDIALEQRSALRFAISVNVTLPPPADQSTSHVAYYGMKDTTYSRSDAEDKIRELNEDRDFNENRLPCWVRGTISAPTAISLRRITTSSSVYLAWAGTFMAAVIGVILITVCSSSAGSTMGVRALAPLPLAPPPPVAKSVHLTERQAARICARFNDRLPRSAARDWTCSICLEDDHDGDVASSKDMLDTTVLPCGHRFHGACIKQWLWKGKGLCPLCKWDARKFIAAEKQAGMEEEWDTGTTTGASSAVPDSAPLSQSSLALAPAVLPPSPLRPPAAVARTQNVSHVSIDVDELPPESAAAAPPRRHSHQDAAHAPRH